MAQAAPTLYNARDVEHATVAAPREASPIELVQQQNGFNIERAAELVTVAQRLCDRLGERINGPRPKDANKTASIPTPDLCRRPLSDQAKMLDHLIGEIGSALGDLDRLI